MRRPPGLVTPPIDAAVNGIRQGVGVKEWWSNRTDCR